MVQRLKLLVLSLVLILFGFMGNITSVYADVITLPNDGLAVEVPYGDSHIANSYENADYYDCYIPYMLSVKDIGGWAKGYYDAKKDQFRHSMSDYPKRLEYKIGCSSIARQGDKKSGSLYHGTRVAEDVNTGLDVFVDANGNEYYASALPFFCYNFGGLLMEDGSSFPPWGADSNGQVFDVILTDGTCIHFVVCDHKARAHTNWGEDGVSAKNDDVCYNFEPIVYPQYANIFQAANGETLELWGKDGCTSAFKSKYGISPIENKVAIIRMYNIDLDAGAPTRSANVGTGVSYSLADSVSITNTEGSYALGNNSLYSAGSTLVEEWQLVGMPSRSDLAEKQGVVSLPTRDNLGIKEQSAVVFLGENIDLVKEVESFNKLRVLVTTAGLLVVVYGIAILVGILFDKANAFVEISVISLLTFGKLKYDPWTDNQSKDIPKGYVSAKKLVIIAVVVILVGFLILSSTLTRFISGILFKITLNT